MTLIEPNDTLPRGISVHPQLSVCHLVLRRSCSGCFPRKLRWP